jgi:hypothetical protein
MRDQRRPIASRREFTRLAMVTTITALGPTEAWANGPADATYNSAAALASHPIIGRWLAVTALGPADLHFDAGGEVLIVWPHSGDGGQSGNYYEYSTSAIGAWRPVSDVDFDVVVTMGDIDDSGSVTGATTMESRARVAKDGASFRAIGPADRMMRATFTSSPSLDLVTSLAPMSGIRMRPE